LKRRIADDIASKNNFVAPSLVFGPPNASVRTGNEGASMTGWIRKILIAIGALAALSFASSAMAQERLTVTTYSAWAREMQACLLDPFTKATGVTVVAEPGTSAINLTKVIQEKADPAHDVVWIDSGVSEEAWSDGVADPLDPKTIPNIAGLADVGVHKSKDGQIYAISTGFYAMALVYNSQEVKQKPTSWWDLWEPQYANRVSLPGPSQGGFVPLFFHLNKLLGGSDTNFEPAIQKFKELKPYSYYDAAATLSAALQARDVVMAANYFNSAWQLNDQGLPTLPAVPREGAVAGDIRAHLVKGTKHKAAAEKFINFVIAPEQLSCMSNRLYLGTPLKNPKLSDKEKERMPWGPSGSINDLVLPNWDVVKAKRAEIIDLWNRRVVGR
jgi:putative spermidine/putrescine transport system substrate-binding protein